MANARRYDKRRLTISDKDHKWPGIKDFRK